MKRRYLKYSALAACIGISPITTVMADEATSFSEILTKSATKFNLRYRYEYVDDNSSAKDANASTLKSRITWSSATYQGFSGLVEVDNVSHIGGENYATPSNGKAGEYPIVADPDGTDINQVYLKYKSDGFTGITGRQRILHAGQRFIGGVGWRQNEQTYDSFRLQLPVGPVSLDYSYIWDVNRIFGPDTNGGQPRRYESDSHAIYASFSPAEGHTIGLYSYLLDFDNAAANSSETYGIEYKGAIGPVSIAAAVATQSDYKDNPVDYDAEYYMAELGYKVKGVALAAGYEQLGSDGGNFAFRTPLATLHKFQGWADKFLVTPANGIEDTYFKVATKVGPTNVAIFYHDFSADEGSADYGTEFDAVVTYPINKNIDAQLKYAKYDAEDLSTDTDKLWFTVNLKF
ncbi:MAG: porin [Porticoccus sp.]|nr:porin [Porticoccus sp.]MBQ0807613.1 porin [Porticoccus sp.]